MNNNQDFPTPKKGFYKVYVNTITYNQSQYIEDCLNGVAMQNTTFPFVHHVIDDASTDGEQDIIKEWMNRECNMNTAECFENDVCTINIAQNRKNNNCTVAAYFLKKNLYREPKEKEALCKPWRDVCPYEALCEGDDYWTCPEKLQKQYTLLEKHPEYSLCHHNNLILQDGKLTERKGYIPYEQDLLSIAENNTVHTQTMFFRNIGGPVIPNDFPFKYPVYQFFMNVRLAEFGKIVYIDEPMAVYRISPGGVHSMKKPRERFTMAMGNLENMIDWYTKGFPRPDVIEALKRRVKRVGLEYIKQSIKYFQFSDTLFMWKWYIRLQKQ